MNRHTKMAIFIAPLLLVGGYIAAEFYENYKTEKLRYHVLSTSDDCDMGRGKCVLTGGGLTLEIANVDGVTTLKGDHSLDTAAIGIGTSEKPTNFRWHKDSDTWSIVTDKYALEAKGAAHSKVRMIVTVKDQIFFSEFDTQSIYAQ